MIFPAKGFRFFHLDFSTPKCRQLITTFKIMELSKPEAPKPSKSRAADLQFGSETLSFPIENESSSSSSEMFTSDVPILSKPEHISKSPFSKLSSLRFSGSGKSHGLPSFSFNPKFPVGLSNFQSTHSENESSQVGNTHTKSASDGTLIANN
jgi:hypothetical protein